MRRLGLATLWKLWDVDYSGHLILSKVEDGEREGRVMR